MLVLHPRLAVRAAARKALPSLAPRVLQPQADAFMESFNAHAADMSADEFADAQRALCAHEALFTLLATAPPSARRGADVTASG